MKAYDFEYAGQSLSDKGFIICNFDSSGIDTVSNGSEITFNTVSTLQGAKHELASAVYEDCLTATFQICKHPCFYSDEMEIYQDEARDIVSWLNRKSFHRFNLVDEEGSDIYYDASFNVSKIECDGRLVGFELEMFTNRPYGYAKTEKITIDNTSQNGEKVVKVKTDEEGFIYPRMEITITGDCDFSLYNEAEDRTMLIKGCKANEVLTIDYPIISSSLSSHKINDDFNWRFFRLSYSYGDNKNRIVMSHPCTIKMEYEPIVKLGV